MKRPTLTETAIGLALAVAVATPFGYYLTRPEPAHAVVRTCPDGTPPSHGGYDDDVVPVCQVGSIRNP